MEEIPGKQTFEILRQRLVDMLAPQVQDFPKTYPMHHSCRALPDQDMRRYIDHTLLKHTAAALDFAKLCHEAREWGVWSVCVPSNRVVQCVAALEGSEVKVCTVAGFPFGYQNTKAKVEESIQAIAEGAQEIDMVVSLGLVKDQNWLGVYHDVRSVTEACKGIMVKVILETSELSLEEKVLAAYAACFAGAAFLKTSTGFGSGGAQIDDIHVLRHVAGKQVGVKASGGVRTRDFAKALVQAGADRIGTSGTASILELAALGGQGY